jgi:hypothetical protein
MPKCPRFCRSRNLCQILPLVKSQGRPERHRPGFLPPHDPRKLHWERKSARCEIEQARRLVFMSHPETFTCRLLRHVDKERLFLDAVA